VAVDLDLDGFGTHFLDPHMAAVDENRIAFDQDAGFAGLGEA
jgi:hypothetical protein